MADVRISAPDPNAPNSGTLQQTSEGLQYIQADQNVPGPGGPVTHADLATQDGRTRVMDSLEAQHRPNPTMWDWFKAGAKDFGQDVQNVVGDVMAGQHGDWSGPSFENRRKLMEQSAEPTDLTGAYQQHSDATEGGAAVQKVLERAQATVDEENPPQPQPPAEPPHPTYSDVATRIVNRLFGLGGEERYQTWPERTVRSAATLAGDVVSGKVLSAPGLRREDVTDQPRPGGMTVAAEPQDTMIERTQDLAGAAVLGSAPAVVAKGVTGAARNPTLGTFLGASAMTADRGQLNVARMMEGQGATQRDIWDKTGWFRGVDGGWRFEVPDERAVINPEVLRSQPNATPGEKVLGAELFDRVTSEETGDAGGAKTMDPSIAFIEWDTQKNGDRFVDIYRQNKEYPEIYMVHKDQLLRVDVQPTYPKLAELIDHSELFKNYPTLRSISVSPMVPEGAAGVSHGGKIGVLPELGAYQMKSTTLHEIQHEVSRLEGFMVGRGPAVTQEQLTAVRAEMTMLDNAETLVRMIESELGKSLDKVTRGEELNNAIAKATIKWRNMGGSVETGGWLHALRTDEQPAAIADAIRDARDRIQKAYQETEKQVREEHDYYWRQASEVEARNVQRRMMMSPGERKRLAPWETEDVPRGKQILNNANKERGSIDPGSRDFGQGWWFDMRSNKMHSIDDGSLGPHGDHDGWITIGDNAKQLGIDEKSAAAFQTATYGTWGEAPLVKEFVKEHPQYAEKMGDELWSDPRYQEEFQKFFGMSVDDAIAWRPNNLARIRKWPDGHLTINTPQKVKSAGKFVDELLNNNPELMNGVRNVLVESSDDHTWLTTADFMSGKWNRGTSSPPGRTPAPAAPVSNAPPFYSAVSRAVDAAPMEKAPVSDWLGYLRNHQGVKPEEMRWIGLEDFLKSSRKGKLTKQEVQDYVRQNEVQLKEVRLAGQEYEPDVRRIGRGEHVNDNEVEYQYEDNNSGETFAVTVDKDAGNVTVETNNGKFLDVAKLSGDGINRQDISSAEVAIDRYLKNLGKDPGAAGPTQYGPDVHPRLSLPGGENYREFLLTMPTASKPLNVEVKPTDNGGWTVFTNGQRTGSIGAPIGGGAGFTEEQALHIARASASENYVGRSATAEGTYRTPHWSEPNVLAHARVDDRVIDGKKTLFLQEVQSDWHQQGRRKGYREPFKELTAEDLVNGQVVHDGVEATPTGVKTGTPKWAFFNKNTKDFEYGWGATEDEARQSALTWANSDLRREVSKSGVPDAPFKKTWPELVLKRMIRLAAEEGYDQVAWTPGEIQAARYDMSKQIKSIQFQKNQDGTYLLVADTVQGGMHKFGDSISADKLPDTVGKDIADKIVSNEKGVGQIEGGDLKVGGEGMKNFYDKELVAAANKLGKKYGVKVERKEMTWNDEQNEQYGKESMPDGWKLDYATGHDEGWFVTNDQGTQLPKTFKSLDDAVNTAREKAGYQPVNFPEDRADVFVLSVNKRLERAALSEGFPLFASGVPVTPGQSADPFGTRDPNKDQARVPPQAAIDALKERPDLRHHFDEKYGPGAAQRFIGSTH